MLSIFIPYAYGIFITVIFVTLTWNLWEKCMIYYSGIPKCNIEEKRQLKIKYGEKAVLKANCVFHSTLRSVQWHKIKYGRSFAINIQSKKYGGSSNDYRNPVLCINSFDENDDACYRLEVQYEYLTDYSNTIKLEAKTGTKQYGFHVKSDSHLYIGREICLNAISTAYREKVFNIVWHKKMSGVKSAIDISLPKYEGSSLEGINPVLRIKGFNQEDVGLYFCTYADKWGTHESSYFWATLEEGPPKILKINERIEGDLGSDIEITATILSFPNISDQVRWFKDGEEIAMDTIRMQSVQEESRHKMFCKLRIKYLGKQDRGDYYLVAKNEKGTVQSNVLKLDAYGDTPEIEIISESIEGEYGKVVCLKTKVKSRPRVSEYRWFKENEENKFCLDLKTKKYENSSYCTLMIKNLNFHDDGRYRLEVFNGVDHCVSNWLTVKVTGNPSFLISGPTMLSSERKIEFLAISLKPKMNFIQGTWQKDGCDIDLKDERCKWSTSNGPNPKLIITDITPKDSCKYRFCVGDEKSNEVPVHVSDEIRPSSEYENNCLRLYQLVTLSAEGLRKKLEDLVKDLEKFLINEKDNIKKDVLDRNFKKLFPEKTTAAKSSKEFDTSLLYSLLRNNSPLKSQLWKTKPQKEDQNDSDNVQRVRNFRNDICHLEKLKVTTCKFNDDWLELAKAVENLSNGSLLPRILSIQNCATIEGEQMQIMRKEIEQLKKEMDIFDGIVDRSRISTATYIFAKVSRREKSKAVTQYIDQICKIFDILFSLYENGDLVDLILDDLKSSLPGFPSSETFNLLETVKRNVNSVIHVPELYVKESTVFALEFKKKFNFPVVTFKSNLMCISVIIQFTSDEDHKLYQAYVTSGDMEHSFKDVFLNKDLLKKFELKSDDFSLSIKDVGKFEKSKKIKVTIISPSKPLDGETTYIRGLILSPIEPHSVTWKKDGSPIDVEDEKYEGSIENVKQPLLCINFTSQEDVGMYSLMVSTAVETTESSKIPVTIKTEPTRVAIKGSNVVHVGSTAVFKAMVLRSNQLSSSNIRWQRHTQNGKKVIDLSQEKYRGSTMCRGIELVINDVQPSDEGIYEIYVDGAEDNISLDVIENFEKPQTWSRMPPELNCMLFDVSPSSLEFEEVKQKLADSSYATRVRKIERIQNKKWFYQYTAMRVHLQVNKDIEENEKDAFAPVRENFFDTNTTEKPEEYYTTATVLSGSLPCICLCSAFYGKSCPTEETGLNAFINSLAFSLGKQLDSLICENTQKVIFTYTSQILPKYLIYLNEF